MGVHVHNPQKLLESLCVLPRETGWVEFKENKFDEDSVGQYVSSLANSAMFERRDAAYLVFGVRNDDHAVVGTTVDLLGETVGNESFILWLNKYLEPHIGVNVESFDYDERRVEILCIDPGYRQPVKFKKIPYVRIGSAQQPLSNYPERERALWQITSRYSFESSFLTEHLNASQIGELFAVKHLMRALKLKLEPKAAFEYMADAGWMKSDLQGKYEVTSLLAIAGSYNLNYFPSLLDKGTRVIVYKGKDKLDAISDTEGSKGHLVTFVSLST